MRLRRAASGAPVRSQPAGSLSLFARDFLACMRLRAPWWPNRRPRGGESQKFDEPQDRFGIWRSGCEGSLSITKVCWANNEPGNFLLDRRAFYS